MVVHELHTRQRALVICLQRSRGWLGRLGRGVGRLLVVGWSGVVGLVGASLGLAHGKAREIEAVVVGKLVLDVQRHGLVVVAARWLCVFASASACHKVRVPNTLCDPH